MSERKKLICEPCRNGQKHDKCPVVPPERPVFFIDETDTPILTRCGHSLVTCHTDRCFITKREGE